MVNAGAYLQQVFGYKDYFFLTAGLRVDGNSAFGSGFGLQAYPKLSASYILSDMSLLAQRLVRELQAPVRDGGRG